LCGNPSPPSGLAGRNVVRGDTDAREVLPGRGDSGGGGRMRGPIRLEWSGSAGGVPGEVL